MTQGLSRTRVFGESKGNQATFDNSQRNNLRSCAWVSFGGSVGDLRAGFSSVGAGNRFLLTGGSRREI